jgi:fibronectin type 3 domain-containing protein
LPIRYGHPSASRLRPARRLPPAPGERSPGRADAALSLLLAAMIGLAGCAAPGAPRAPSDLVPESVTDLRAHQAGTSVVLHFTLPREATDGKSLAGPPRIEIYRQFHAAGAPPVAEPEAAGAVSGAPAYTLSARQLTGDLAGDTVTWTDAFSAGDFESHRGQTVSYRVRTAAGTSDWSAPSKAAVAKLVVPPSPALDLTATVSGAAVELRWKAPAPGPSPSPETFLVYRTTLGPDGAATGAPLASSATTGTSYRDVSVEPDHSYRYTVRGVARVNGQEVESADSEAVVVRVHPAPPSAPEGLTAIPIRQPGRSPEVDLSWEIGSEANLAGYNVYRSEQPGRRGERLNRQVLAAPAFRDTTVTPGRSYSYTVTAVDPTGIESQASAPVTVSVPKASSSPQ